MHLCKYCQVDNTELSISLRANHTRWCKERPDRKEVDELHSLALIKSANNRWGVFKDYDVTCSVCKKLFSVNVREKLFDPNVTFHCSKSCANTKGGNALSIKNGSTGRSSYRARAFKMYGSKSCLICGFDKVVEIHHIDHDHDNNKWGNIVILCPNHHMMIHRSKYSEEVKSDIKRILGGWVC